MSVSGLGHNDRVKARSLAVQAAFLGLQHANELHYTEDAQRWQGIALDRIAAKGEFPEHADCSAFYTWCLWNGLHVEFGIGDTVNDLNWKAGYTGTMIDNGREVIHIKNVLRADAVLYGTYSKPSHTAIVVGHDKNGLPMVVSNGSEAGPFLLPYNYRSDVAQFRRYV